MLKGRDKPTARELRARHPRQGMSTERLEAHGFVMESPTSPLEEDLPPLESADAEISPRPLPTGKLHRNMHILNSIVRVIGKTSAYMDEQEADEAHFINPAHAPAKVLTVEDPNTGEVVPASEVVDAPAGSAPGSNSASQAVSKAGSKAGSVTGSVTGGGEVKADSVAGSNASSATKK